MKKIFGIVLVFLLTGCTFFEEPEGTVQVETGSVHTRIEKTSATEEIVYCTADLKITNTGDKTIYNCTISAVVKSDTDIEHYISLNYDVNIPPSQSVYVTAEWNLVRHIETITEVISSTSDEKISGSTDDRTNSKNIEKVGSNNKTETRESGSETAITTTDSDDKSTTVIYPGTITTTSNLGGTTITEENVNTTTGTTSNTGTTINGTTSTTTVTSLSASNEETDWKKDSIKIMGYFFN